MFSSLQEALEKNGRNKLQRIYGTYGVRAINGEFNGYSAADTIVSPEVSLKKANETFKEYKELLPGGRYNKAGHSLGGWIDFWVAAEHPNDINNLMLFSAPIRGVEQSEITVYVVSKIREFLKSSFNIDEQVSGYMFDLWKDKAYQRKVDKALEDLQKAGVRVRSYANARDLIVSPKSSELVGVTKVIGNSFSLQELVELTKTLASVISPELVLKPFSREHGRTRDDQGIINEVVGFYGRDLSLAA